MLQLDNEFSNNGSQEGANFPNLSFFQMFTSSGRVATSGAQISDVKDVPVGTKIVLTWI